jgi:hypothetical protein
LSQVVPSPGPSGWWGWVRVASSRVVYESDLIGGTGVS